MEYMRTLLRDNELFRTYVTVSPPQSRCLQFSPLCEIVPSPGAALRKSLAALKCAFLTVPPRTQRARPGLHFQIVS